MKDIVGYYKDKHGEKRAAMPHHFTQPYGISSSRRWWSYLQEMAPSDRARYIKEWYLSGHVSDHQLWDVLGSFGSPVSAAVAVKVYEDLGFEPLAGFPLTKKEVI